MGLAERRPSATDRRAREVAITANGRRVLGRARTGLAEAEAEVLQGLDDPERAQLADLLRRALRSAPALHP